jgi:Tol biopolymer transport system component
MTRLMMYSQPGRPTGVRSPLPAIGVGITIYVMAADGTNVRPLTGYVEDDLGPDWSPDGKEIAFASKIRSGVQIMVMNADGSGLDQLTSEPSVTQENPDWSTDGSKVAYSRGNDDAFDIYVMNADGSGPERLTIDPGFEGEPAWAPAVISP